MPETKTTVQVKFGDLAIVNRITEPAPPPVLHHYTRRAGLLGIFDSRELHASNARYLNDAQELSLAMESVKEIAEQKQKTTTGEEVRLWKAINHFLDTLEPRWDVFVFSLSEDSDQLSQWRAYTRPGNGYSIGFDSTKIADLADPSTFHLAKCYYKPDDHVALLDLIVTDCQNTLERELDAPGADPMKAHTRALAVFVSSFFVVAPVLKHPKFAEEREWRLIRPIGSVWEPGVRFRDGSGLLVPYYVIDLGKQTLPIAEVRVGPTAHADLEKRALSGLLTLASTPDATVGQSDVPYRS